MKQVRPFRAMLVLAAFAGLSAIAACGSTPTSPSSPPYSQVDLREGSGEPAVTGQNATVAYTGWLYDPSKPDSKGLQFDSRTEDLPLIFTLGGNQMIAGWDKGVPGMKPGGIRRLVIPPSLAYGETRNGPIPPNAALVFDILLLKAENPQQ